jgi:hypothetical protein
MFADGVGRIVSELQSLRLSNSGLVATDRSEASAGTEIKGREGVRGGVLADVYPGQVELRERTGAFDGKVNPKRASFSNFGVMV